MGLQANKEKAEGWLAKNAIIITALNPLIGYQTGAALVKQALKENRPIGAVAEEKAAAGELKHVSEDRKVTAKEIQAALSDLRRLTEGGIVK